MEFEKDRWEDLNETEKNLAIDWHPPPIHPQLREAFRECVEQEVRHFDLGKSSLIFSRVEL